MCAAKISPKIAKESTGGQTQLTIEVLLLSTDRLNQGVIPPPAAQKLKPNQATLVDATPDADPYSSFYWAIDN